MPRDRKRSVTNPISGKPIGGEVYSAPQILEHLSDYGVFRLSRDVRDGLAGADAARRIMVQFVAEGFTRAGPSRNLIVHIRDALAEYLAGGKTLDAAFRVKHGRRGRPNVQSQRNIDMATMMLKLRVIDGQTYEDAAWNTGERFHRSRSTICKAFDAHKLEAYNALVRGSSSAIDNSCSEQTSRLRNIFPWL